MGPEFTFRFRQCVDGFAPADNETEWAARPLEVA
jgi:hypothetical protein